MKIAFLGTGLMGTGFVRRLLANGHQVTVWNRSPDKAAALAAFGATVADTPLAAIAGAEQIHLSLSDDSAVDSVLAPLAEALGPDVFIVDHTTTAPTPTRERAARWTHRGHKFVHAPVFMTPANAEAGTGIMLVCGPQAYHQAQLPLLATMTGNVVYLGEAADRAAAFKLFGNMTLLIMMGALADVNRLAHACGISTQDAFGLFSQFNPGAMLPARAAKIAKMDGQPSFELSMARKDLRLMIEEAEANGVRLAVTPAVAALLDDAIEKHGAGADVTAAAWVAA